MNVRALKYACFIVGMFVFAIGIVTMDMYKIVAGGFLAVLNQENK
jgi:uncharacterized membrane protein YiaA